VMTAAATMIDGQSPSMTGRRLKCFPRLCLRRQWLASHFRRQRCGQVGRTIGATRMSPMSPDGRVHGACRDLPAPLPTPERHTPAWLFSFPNTGTINHPNHCTSPVQRLSSVA